MGKMGGGTMSKNVSFTDNDKELVKQIQAFQKSQNLPSFIEAVRRLCKNGLHLSSVVKDLK